MTNSSDPTPQAGIDEPALVARGIRKIYKGSDRPAVDLLDLSINTGEIFGLLGPNGAGKTTTISILSTLIWPDSGSVSLCGIDAVRHPDKVRNIISLVPQDIALYPELTARENLTFFGKLHGLGGKRLKLAIDETLEIVGLAQMADQRVFTFSGGMKRRANLAVGILNRPKILFLDEPTVGIDAQSRNMILEKLRVLRDEGMTMVYTTHYMEEAEALCSTVLVIDEGKSIACGSPDELVGNYDGCADLQELFFNLTGKKLRD